MFFCGDYRVADDERTGWGIMECPDGCAPECGRIAMRDGVEIFYRSWIRDRADAVIVIPGLGAHGGWFIEFGNRLAAAGVTVLIPDLRGFGRSGGKRGHVRHASLLLDDLSAVIYHFRANRLADKLHLLGHSMGAVLATHLATRHDLTTLALVNPWLEDQTGTPGPIVAAVAIEGLFGSTHRWRLGGGLDRMTDNPEARVYLEHDSYWVREESASFFFQILRLRMRMLKAARRVQTPAIVVQTGGDLIVRNAASRRLYEQLGTPQKRWVEPPHVFHDFEFADSLGPVVDPLLKWFAGERERSAIPGE